MAGTESDDRTRASAGLLGGLVSKLRERVAPSSTYVEWSDIPDETPAPYRARLTLTPEQSPDGVEVREREVVRAKVRIFYEVRCECGKRWFHRKLEKLELCPRCNRAVLVQAPD